MISDLWFGRLKIAAAVAVGVALAAYHVARLAEVRDEEETRWKLKIEQARTDALNQAQTQQAALTLAAVTRADALAARLARADASTTKAMGDYHAWLSAHPDSGATLRPELVVRINEARQAVFVRPAGGELP